MDAIKNVTTSNLEKSKYLQFYRMHYDQVKGMISPFSAYVSTN